MNENYETDLNSLYTAEEVPIKYERDVGIEEANHLKGVYNTGTGRLAAVVANNYNIVQHKDYIESVSEALDNLNIPYNVKLSQQDNKMVADFEFSELKKTIREGEEFTLGIRLVNSYDKTTGIVFMPRMKRLVCDNGMTITTAAQAMNIRHTSKEAIEIDKSVQRRIKEMINMDDKLTAWVNTCIEDSVEWNTVAQIIEKINVSTKWKEKFLDELGIDRIVTKPTKEELQKGVLPKIEYFLKVKLDTKQITRWEVYNAITSIATHDEQITPALEQWLQQKATTVLTTPTEELIKVEAV